MCVNAATMSVEDTVSPSPTGYLQLAFGMSILSCGE